VELVFQDLGPDQTPFTNDDGLGGPLPDDRYSLWVICAKYGVVESGVYPVFVPVGIGGRSARRWA
jgi:hypothetical protein